LSKFKVIDINKKVGSSCQPFFQGERQEKTDVWKRRFWKIIVKSTVSLQSFRNAVADDHFSNTTKHLNFAQACH